MESQDNISPSNTEEPDMGNEVSHREGVRQSVGGEGHTGQFHKVFVEPKISEESDVIAPNTQPLENIHDQATLKIRGSVATEKNEHEADAEQQRPKLSDEEYKLIVKCKALITEAAGRAEERQSLARPSCSEQVTDLDEISQDQVGDDVFVVDHKSTSEKETSNEIVDLDATYTNIEALPDTQREKTGEHTTGKTKSPKKSPTKNKNYALKCGIVTDDDFNEKSKRESEVKQKQKQKAVDEKKQSSTASPIRRSDSKCKNTSENTDAVVKQSPKRNPLKMFKFSKRKAKVNADVTSDTKGKKIDGIEEENVNEEIVNSNKVSDGEIATNGNVIKRLNSLDSGIVVDKVTEQQLIDGVEYAVVQKKKATGLTPTKKVDKDDSPRKSETENGNAKPDGESEQSNGTAKEEGKEAVYMNGNRDDQDFVYINERAIDISGLVEPVTNKVLETLPNVKADDVGGSDLTSDRSGNEAEIQSIISSDSGASSGTKYKIIDKEKPEKAKLKKKSWSFQVLGKKEKKGSSDGLDADSGSRVSMDPSASPPPETKKSKWLFGKFSFRRSSDDMTSSTPNLQQAGIPEEQEADGVNVKSRSKLKKKGKDKKKKSPKKEMTSLERRSTSLMDIVVGDSNAPRSRRNSSNQGVNQGIIEDDIEYTPTDAFEGVTLSDLSQDEEAETEVTLNPSGAKKSAKEKNTKTEKTVKPKTPVDVAVDKLATIANIKLVSDDSSVNVKAAASDKVEEEYMNVVDVGKSTDGSIDADNKFTSEIVEDEYVNVSNVVAAKSEPVESVTGAPEPERIDVDGDEYAVVIKKPAVTESANVKESDETSVIKGDEELMKEYGLDKTQMTENNVEKVTTEDVVVPVSSEKAYSNMIYSDEEFNASLSKLTECNDDKKVKSDECVEDKELDEYVQLKDIVPDYQDETVSVKTENIASDNKYELESTKKEDIPSDNKHESESTKTEDIAPDNNNGTEPVKTENVVPENKDKTEHTEKENVVLESNDTSESIKTEGESACNDDKNVTETVTVEQVEEIKTESSKVENTDEGKEIIEESIISEKRVKVEAKPVITGESTEFVDETVVSENIVKVENTPQEAEMELTLSSPIKTVVMKDIGVQVPDIHMPLDIDADFGNNAGEVTSTSIGVQVDCKDLDDVSHIVVTMETNKEATFPPPPSDV